MNKNRRDTVLRFAALVELKHTKDVLEIGRELVDLDVDKLFGGGFWIWDVEEDVIFYSPKFIATLGYTDSTDFPPTPESWRKAMCPIDLEITEYNFEMHIKTKGKHPFSQKVKYKKKSGDEIEVLCSGTILKNKELEPTMVVGTHEII